MLIWALSRENLLEVKLKQAYRHVVRNIWDNIDSCRYRINEQSLQ